MASVVLELRDGTVSSARVCLGAVAPVPWRSAAAEAAITGKAITEEVAAMAGERAVADARPLSQNRYKVQLARTAVKRAILAATTGRRV
jgi:xanthine dehydrogenase YagS FAD-binding subunit